ncbi:Shedu anti-phage system protein SduA domain-containing protein [Streptomyces sp. NPDC046928]|uniref:Shedu anti-phage system protein SduA domain-containing protein n=1 Tax=Streptomyces sp. NPDC046928 TaxID=3155021 RepID=UPI0033CB885C
MSPAENLARLWQLLDTNHEAPSAHKYDEARKFVGQLINVTSSRVYITYISKAGNLSVRGSQSTGALKSDVVIALIKRRTEDPATHRAARSFVERTGKPVFLLQRASEESIEWHPMGGYVLSVDPRGQDFLTKLADVFDAPPHQVIPMSADFAAINAIQYLEGLGITGSVMGSALSEWHDLKNMFASVIQSEIGLSSAEVAVVSQRRKLVAELKEMIADPSTTERDLHNKIKGHYWVFGGRYTGVSDRNSLIPMDEYDIPLFCADGSIHIVELKGSYIKKLVERQRSHLIPGKEVHKAVGQAMNYLRDLDEAGAAMETYYRRNGIEYDLCRARATVVIGNPDHVEVPADTRLNLGPATRQTIDQAIRTYNALINRIEVVTWADLLDAADRSLKFEEESAGSLAEHVDVPSQRTSALETSQGAEDEETIF